MDPIARSAKIKAQLFERGLSLRAVDRANGLTPNTCAQALRDPHAAAEQAIADALGIAPSELWPERYDDAGRRLDPQPMANYRRPPTMAQRRKAKGKQTASVSEPAPAPDTATGTVTP